MAYSSLRAAECLICACTLLMAKRGARSTSVTKLVIIGIQTPDTDGYCMRRCKWMRCLLSLTI